MQASKDIVFDYQDALELARELYAVADQLEGTLRARSTQAGEAQAGFSGPHADTFAAWVAREVADGHALAAALRSDAALCAQAWKKAMDDENRVIYGRHVDRLKKQRSGLTTVWEDRFGYHYPPEPDPVPIPQPPVFAETAGFVHYS
ncbi:MAG TPA: hypothetical protein VFW71_00545 [Actinomycetota bacterium]|nr:hypothetical protein [Actinomycetota bacterium]